MTVLPERYAAFSLVEVSSDTYIKVPEYIPDPPIPAMTRPTMRALMVGAAPQIALPTSNSRILKMYSHRMLKMPYALPQGRIAVVPRANPVPIHGRSSMLSKSRSMEGWISATMVLSSAKRKVVESMAV